MLMLVHWLRISPDLVVRVSKVIIAAASRLYAKLLLAGLFLAMVAFGADTSGQPSPQLCIVPIADGQPTEADEGDAWRMVFRVVLLPDIPRPIIYPSNRSGVWTIDETGSYVRFGGKFPSNQIHDRFARDPSTKRVVGTNSFDGLFKIDAGATRFEQIVLGKEASLDHPGAPTFVPRLDGFVVPDPTGLYLLDRRMRLALLPVDAPANYGGPGEVFDLPEINALLISAGDRVFLRFDDGRLVLIATLEKWDFVTGTTVGSKGTSIAIKTYWNEFAVELPPRHVDGAFEEPVDAHLVRPRPQPGAGNSSEGRAISVASIGKTLVWKPTGLWEREGDRLTPIALPFDPTRQNLTDVAEFPPLKVVVIFSRAGIFTLDAEARVSEVSGGRNAVGPGSIRSEGIIPLRNEMIVLGNNALHLLAKSGTLGRNGCLSARDHS